MTYARDDFRLGAVSDPSSPSTTRCRGSLIEPLLAVRGIVPSSPGFSFKDAFRRKAMLSVLEILTKEGFRSRRQPPIYRRISSETAI
jgi:hypothetical protein